MITRPLRAGAAKRRRSRPDRHQGFVHGAFHHIDLLRFSERTNSPPDDMAHRVAPRVASAKTAVLHLADFSCMPGRCLRGGLVVSPWIAGSCIQRLDPSWMLSQ